LKIVTHNFVEKQVSKTQSIQVQIAIVVGEKVENKNKQKTF